MLKDFAALWLRDGVMKDVVEKLARMINDAGYVFEHAWEACRGQAVIAEIQEPLRERDKAVNRAEREIRRLLVEHLTINPGKDVSGCLAVMNMAKDAERVGDHARNVFDMAAIGEGRIRNMRFFQELDALSSRIGPIFPKLERGILESSTDLAHELLEQYQVIKQQGKDLRNRLFDADFAGREAVITALLVRYLVRINAHTGNVASGIIFPLENIDFVSRGLKAELRDR